MSAGHKVFLGNTTNLLVLRKSSELKWPASPGDGDAVVARPVLVELLKDGKTKKEDSQFGKFVKEDGGKYYAVPIWGMKPQ